MPCALKPIISGDSSQSGDLAMAFLSQAIPTLCLVLPGALRYSRCHPLVFPSSPLQLLVWVAALSTTEAAGRMMPMASTTAHARWVVRGVREGVC